MIVTLVILTTAWICAVISTEPTAYAKSDFAQGDGTKENPFVVTNVDEFNAVATRLDAYFVQGANIDFTGREFFPIGDAMLIVGRSDDEKEKPQDIVDKD